MNILKRLRAAIVAAPTQLRWLVPGMGVKRWIGLLIIGAFMVALGLAYWLVDLSLALDRPALIDTLTLQFIPRLARALLFGAAGLALVLFAVARLNRAVLEPFVRPGQDVAQAVSEHRRRGRGSRIVAIGGGTGLATLLRGLKEHTSNLTAIVTVADDGGSSGRLRQSLGVLPPGDFRNCIAALADDESLITQLFHYRFGHDDELGGHSFGNLFISAMADVSGSFEQALSESSRVLNIRGQVVPSTLGNVTLIGEVEGEGRQVSVVEGESRIPQGLGAIRRVYLRPDSVGAYPPAIRAVLEANLIVLGPGSLYTSVMPNLLVPDLAAAIRASRAVKVYVCNTATQPGETNGYSIQDHAAAIERHTGPGLFDYVLANDRWQGELLAHLDWVRPGPTGDGSGRTLTGDLADAERPWRHDSTKLAKALINLLAQAAADQDIAYNPQ